MYFKNFDKIYYDYEINGERKIIVVTDILKNVRVRKEILSNITIYDEYDIRDGETIEVIAEKVYGNPNYHWIIMLVNEKYDYVDDFPLATYELEQAMRSKYGQAVSLILTASVTNSNSFTVNSTEGLKVGWNIAFKQTGQNTTTQSYITSIDSPTRFSIAKTVNVPVSTKIDIDPVYGLHHFENENGYVVDSSYPSKYEVSNYEYETRKNESKRRIKLVSKSLIDTILKNFKSL